MALDIEIGQMRSTATLQKNVPLMDNSGGQIDIWSDVCTFRCRIQQKRSSRTLEQMQPMNDKDYQLVCRAQVNITNNIGYDSRIIFKGVVHAVKSFDLQEEDKKHWYVMTICKNG